MRINTIILILFLVFSSQISYAAEAPNIQLKFINTTKSLSDFKGKLVYLDFWASWCTPCRKSFPWMNSMYSKYHGKGLEVVAINLDKDKKQVSRFLGKYSANFKIAFDQTGKTAEIFNVAAMPTSFLIDRSGNILMAHPGFRKKDKQKMEKLIRDNL